VKLESRLNMNFNTNAMFVEAYMGRSIVCVILS
jgi:hypothetical protein